MHMYTQYTLDPIATLITLNLLYVEASVAGPDRRTSRKAPPSDMAAMTASTSRGAKLSFFRKASVFRVSGLGFKV